MSAIHNFWSYLWDRIELALRLQAVTSIYTIGHSNHQLDHFLCLLRQHAVATLVDVRSRPYSKYSPHFQKRPLSEAVAAQGSEYVFLGDRLGGESSDAYRDAHGNVDYVRRAQSPEFRGGLDELLAIAATKATAIMCAEEDPRRCHRRLLITPSLLDRDVIVRHIRGDGRIESEDELGQATRQLSLF